MCNFRFGRAALFGATALLTTIGAFSARAAEPPAAAAAPQPDQEGQLVTEIIVSARKHDERLLDTPVPIAVVNTTALTTTNQTRLEDYFAQVPGLTLAPTAQSLQTVVIRGLAAGLGGAPTVAITVDDVPFGGSALGGSQVPDFDPGDLKQIEVLRGPQGTLYGASSLGGLVKYETVDPSTQALSGRLSAGTSGISGGDGLGYNVRGSVNIPVNDQVAIRASAFDRLDPGWINNPVYGLKGINKDTAYGGRLSELIRPSADLSIKLSAMYQRIQGDGGDDEHLQLGSQKEGYLPGAGAYVRQLQAYSARVDYKVGAINLTSVTGYNDNQVHDNFDLSAGLGFLAQKTFGVSGLLVGDNVEVKKFSQELRLAAPLTSHIDVQLGAFYTKEWATFNQPLLAADTTNGHILGDGADLNQTANFDEYAIFGALTYKFSDKFDVEIGGRESFLHYAYSTEDSGIMVPLLFGEPSPVVVPVHTTSSDVFTYSFTPRYHLSQDMMLYFRAASGYRAGGVNTSPGVPPTYQPDKTDNFEVGLKGNLLDRIITYDASLYYIKWTDIQLGLVTPKFLGYTANGAAAKSEGFELSVDTHPIKGLTLGGWISIGDAALTQNLPAASTAVGKSGDRLPFSSRISASLTADYQFPITGDLTADLGASMNYVGERPYIFGASEDRQVFPGYTKVDLKAGIKTGSGEEVTLYANNVANSRGELNDGFGTATLAVSRYRIRPTEVGLTVTKTF